MRKNGINSVLPTAARVAIGLILIAVVACGIGTLVVWLRLSPDPLEQGRRAYDRGDWNAAARSAREILKTRQGDPAALRLLARSSVQLGRDDAALRIYTRRLEAKTVPGRRLFAPGSGAQASRTRRMARSGPGTEALEAEPSPAQALDELTRLFYKVAVETENPEIHDAASSGRGGTGGRAAPPAAGLGVSGET